MSTDFNDIQVPVIMAPEDASATPGGTLTTTVIDGVISAKRVDVKRDIAAIMTNIKASASVMGEKYYYHWETKNKDGSKGKVEGGTVKLALDIARLYGNCQVDCRATDTGSHLEFHARFVDVESGFSLTRPFRQRKDQNTGMKDKGRAEDIVLQIGASKAIRNVILNSLPTLAEYAMQEAKKGLLNRVAKNPDGARAAILQTIEEIGAPLLRIEKHIGRDAKNWTNKDMARLYVQVESIKDNYATVDDIFPNQSDAALESIKVGNEGVKENLKKKQEVASGSDATIEDKKPEVETIDLIMPDGDVRKFPTEISADALMKELNAMFPPDEKEWVRNNIDVLPKLTQLMRAAGKSADADHIEKIIKG